MREGDILLAPIPQADGQVKPRPVLLLRVLPRCGDYLVCGISTQLHQHVAGFDEHLRPGDSDFTERGLLAASLIRLGFLAVIPSGRIAGTLGSISPDRHARLLKTLSEYLVASDRPPETASQTESVGSL